MLTWLLLVFADSIHICPMYRKLALGADPGNLYYSYLNELLFLHAEDIGKTYNFTVTRKDMSYFQDFGTAGNSILNVDEALKVIAAECDFVIGPYSSGQAKSIIPVLSQAKIPACAVSSTQSLENKVEYPYFIRGAPNDSIQGKVLAQFIIQMKWKKFNLLNNLDAFALGVKGAFIQEIKNHNLQASQEDQVVLLTEIEYESYQKDFNLYLDQIKDSECTINVFLGEDFEFGQMVKSSLASQKELFGEGYIWIGADTLGSSTSSADILYSTPAADRKTPEFIKVNNMLKGLSNNTYVLDDLPYAPFYLSCIDLFFKYIEISKESKKVSTFKELTSNWYLNNSGLMKNMPVNGPSGNLLINYDRDVVTDFDIFQKFDNNKQQKVAFVYKSITNTIVKSEGFQYKWIDSTSNDLNSAIPFSINIDKIAVTVLNTYEGYYYFIIVVSILSIVVMVGINIEGLVRQRGLTSQKILGSLSLLSGFIGCILLVLTPNEVVCGAQKVFGIVAINICGIMLTIVLWKLFKTSNGVRLEIKGKSDENVKYFPYLFIILNALMSITWAITSQSHRQHVYSTVINRYEYVCSSSANDLPFMVYFGVANGVIYCYALFLSYLLKTNKISNRQTKTMNFVLLNACLFIVLGTGFSASGSFDNTTLRMVLSIFLFIATTGLFLTLRADPIRLSASSKDLATVSVDNGHSSTKVMDKQIVSIGKWQATDKDVFYDYVELLDNNSTGINVWKRNFMLLHGNEKYLVFHTIKGSNPNEFQLKSDGVLYKLEFCQSPPIVEDTDRKNKIIVKLDTRVQLTISFSNEEMVRKFKMLLNITVASMKPKLTKTDEETEK